MTRAILSCLVVLTMVTCSRAAEKPFLGVRFGDEGQIEHVFPGAPAEQAGLQVGDRVTAGVVKKDGALADQADATTFDTTAEIQAFLSRCQVGDVLRLSVTRDDKEVFIEPTLVRHTVKYYLTQKDPPRIPGGTVQLGGGTIGGDFTTSGNFVITGPSTVTRSLTQTWTGVMDLRLTKPGDPAPLSVGGALSLAGLLYVHIDGHEPKIGDRFELIAGAASITGEFDELMLPQLAKNLAWRVEYDDVEKMRDLDGDKRYDVTLVVIDGRMPVVEK